MHQPRRRSASCPSSAISPAAAAISQLQPAPARAASSLPCASTPRRPGTQSACYGTGTPGQHHRRAGPAHRPHADLDQDPREGFARQRRLFAALLLIEGLDEAAVRDALHHLRKMLPAEDHGAIDGLPLTASRSACRSECCPATRRGDAMQRRRSSPPSLSDPAVERQMEERPRCGKNWESAALTGSWGTQ